MTRQTLTAAASAAVLSAATAAYAQGQNPLEPDTQAFIDSLAGGQPIYTLSPEDARNVLLGAQQSVDLDLPDVERDDRVLKIGPTGETSIRVYRPKGLDGALPAVIYAHGGGWVLGDKETHDRLISELTAKTGAVFVFVDFKRSPEYRYPVAIEEIYATLEYVAANPDEFGIDANRISVAGDSVGGNMAAVTTLMAKERKGPAITSQLLFYPVTDASMSTASYTQFAEGPWLTKPAMEWFWDQYLPDQDERADIHVSPINASLDQLSGLPPALVITDENDVLRDEGEAYGRKLAAAGVPVQSVRYNGTIHDFVLLNPITNTPAVRAAVDQASEFLQTTLQK